MRSSKITADVRAFFTSYCAAFIRQDAPAIAKHFANLIHVSGDDGRVVTAHVAIADDWRKTIDRLLEMYRAIDVASVEAIGSRRRASPRWSGSPRGRCGTRRLSSSTVDDMYTLARQNEIFRIPLSRTTR